MAADQWGKHGCVTCAQKWACETRLCGLEDDASKCASGDGIGQDAFWTLGPVDWSRLVRSRERLRPGSLVMTSNHSGSIGWIDAHPVAKASLGAVDCLGLGLGRRAILLLLLLWHLLSL